LKENTSSRSLAGAWKSVYERVIIEYKNPSSSAARIGPRRDSAGTKKVVEQIQTRFHDLNVELGQPLNSLFGAGLDGKFFVFVRFRDGQWQVQDPVPVSTHSAERFLWALFNLGKKGKPFSATDLAIDFGADSALAKTAVRVLYAAIREASHPKAEVFFNQWRILFGEVCGYDVDSPSERVGKLADFYDIPSSPPLDARSISESLPQ